MGMWIGKFARVTALTVIAALALTGIAAAAASGTYTGRSASHSASYKFGLKVSGGKIVALAGEATGKCGLVYATAKKPLKLDVPIRHNSFDATIKLNHGVAKGTVLKLSGHFKGSTVSGAFGGSLVEFGKTCSLTQQSFRGTR